MIADFSSYEAYMERYKMFWSEEGDGRPPMLTPEGFRKRFRLLRDCYRTYWQMVRDGREDQAANYYINVINPLENELAIADGSDNFLFDGRHR